MNASSVQAFYPCRVQLFGLPPAAATTPPPPLRPTKSLLQRVSRNLFGSPDPGAISQILQEEQEKQRAYVLQRYNFDIIVGPSPTPTSSATQSNVAAWEKPSMKNPLECGLIAQELEEHEQRLQQATYNLSREGGGDLSAEELVAALETTPPSLKRGNGAPVKCNYSSNNNTKAQIRRTVAVAAEQSLALEPSTAENSNSERLKPYARQTLLTDCYSLRKTKQFNGRVAAAAAVAATPTPAIVTGNRSPHRQLEVLQLPKPMRVAGAAAAAAAAKSIATTTTEATTLTSSSQSQATRKSTSAESQEEEALTSTPLQIPPSTVEPSLLSSPSVTSSTAPVSLSARPPQA